MDEVSVLCMPWDICLELPVIHAAPPRAPSPALQINVATDAGTPRRTAVRAGDAAHQEGLHRRRKCPTPRALQLGGAGSQGGAPPLLRRRLRSAVPQRLEAAGHASGLDALVPIQHTEHANAPQKTFSNTIKRRKNTKIARANEKAFCSKFAGTACKNEEKNKKRVVWRRCTHSLP